MNTSKDKEINQVQEETKEGMVAWLCEAKVRTKG
jgi:hypothetical protein